MMSRDDALPGVVVAISHKHSADVAGDQERSGEGGMRDEPYRAIPPVPPQRVDSRLAILRAPVSGYVEPKQFESDYEAEDGADGFLDAERGVGAFDEVVEEFAEDDDVEACHAVDVVVDINGGGEGEVEVAVEEGGVGGGAKEDVEGEGEEG